MRGLQQLRMILPLVAVATGCANTGIRRPAAAPATASAILLRGVRVFDTSAGTMGDAQDILIEQGRITAVGRLVAVARAVQQIDCTGKFAVPALFDCHTHLAQLTKEGDDALETRLAAFVAKGITQVRDVGGPIDMLSQTSRRISSGEIAGPEIFYSGPLLEASPLTFAYVNEEMPGFTVAVDTPADVDRILPELARQGACMVKTLNKMDKEVYGHLIAVARQYSLRVVHDPGPPLFHRLPMDYVLDLGVTSIEHAKAPWPVVLTDELKEEHDGLLGPETNEMMQMLFMMKVTALGVDSVSPDRLRALADKTRAKGAYLCPTLHVFGTMEETAIGQIKKSQHLEEIPDMMRAGIHQSLAAMEQVSQLVVREFAARGVKLLVGQDGDDPAATFAEMRLLKECGVSEAEIIKGATIYPAQWLGVDDRLGAIAPGKQGRILVVDGDPLADIGNTQSTFLVIQDGRIVRR